MTIQELYSLKTIQKEIEDYEAKIIELREVAEKITPSYDGMPKASGISDKVGKAATAIVAYTEMLEHAVQEKIEQTIKINAYILEIPDAQLRHIMFLRFVNGLSWVNIAMRIGGGNTGDAVRKRCNRYIKNRSKGENRK